MKDQLSYPFKVGNITFLPILHYSYEVAFSTACFLESFSPDAVALEFPLPLFPQISQAAERLPDISVLEYKLQNEKLFILSEPCDPLFEGMRYSLENKIPAFCIDQISPLYPQVFDPIPDPYSISHIGPKEYFTELLKQPFSSLSQDKEREVFMASSLKNLSEHYEKIVCLCGAAHIKGISTFLSASTSSSQKPLEAISSELFSPEEESYREIMGTPAFFTEHYEKARSSMKSSAEENPLISFSELLGHMPDRRELLLSLYKQAGIQYEKATGNTFDGYHLRNLLKFTRKYALIENHLFPSFYQILASARSCVDHNYAYEVWLLSGKYLHLKNLDNLPKKRFSIEGIWGDKKLLSFHLKKKSPKAYQFKKRTRDRKERLIFPLNPRGICSYQAEDLVIESFAKHLKKRGTLLMREEQMRTTPFSTSLEEGIDFRETIRNWGQEKIYVKLLGKPPKATGSVVIVFDPDIQVNQEEPFEESYPWCTTWLGEHNQESDMAFYATPIGQNIVGPGIARCTYGGFMMSYPPCRLEDIWSDPAYQDAKSKAEVLLLAGIDYSLEPVIVYSAKKPPRAALKQYAQRQGKKVFYLPLGQLSPVTLKKLRSFHVLSSHATRAIADDYIF